jgi:hypothetical protein
MPSLLDSLALSPFLLNAAELLHPLIPSRRSLPLVPAVRGVALAGSEAGRWRDGVDPRVQHPGGWGAPWRGAGSRNGARAARDEPLHVVCRRPSSDPGSCLN